MLLCSSFVRQCQSSKTKRPRTALRARMRTSRRVSLACLNASAYVSIPHECVSIRQHTLVYARMRTSRRVSLACLNASAYVSICQLVSAYVSIRAEKNIATSLSVVCLKASAYVSICPGCVSIRQHTRGKERRNTRVGCLPECVT